MAHELETGMYVKKEAWHGLGNVLAEIPTTDEAYQKSGLDWEVFKNPLFYRLEGFNRSFPTDKSAIIRKTDSSVLGYCGKIYEPYQNKDAFDWCAPLIESGMWTWESAGSLRKGQICWALLKQGETQLIPNDILKDYLMVTWSHDGQKSVQIVPTTIRVVCANTLQMALENSLLITKVKHTKTIVVKMEEAKELYGISSAIFKGRNENFKALIDEDWNDTQLEDFAKKLFIVEQGLEGTALANAEKVQQEAIQFVLGDSASGSKELGIKNTAYGAVMAISEFNEHYLGGNRLKDRGVNILFGNGKQLNERAFNLAKELVAV